MQGDARNLSEQLSHFCVFDTRHLINTENVAEAPTLKWNQFFRTPWANSVEVQYQYLAGGYFTSSAAREEV